MADHQVVARSEQSHLIQGNIHHNGVQAGIVGIITVVDGVQARGQVAGEINVRTAAAGQLVGPAAAVDEIGRVVPGQIVVVNGAADAFQAGLPPGRGIKGDPVTIVPFPDKVLVALDQGDVVHGELTQIQQLAVLILELNLGQGPVGRIGEDNADLVEAALQVHVGGEMGGVVLVAGRGINGLSIHIHGMDFIGSVGGIGMEGGRGGAVQVNVEFTVAHHLEVEAAVAGNPDVAVVFHANVSLVFVFVGIPILPMGQNVDVAGEGIVGDLA